MASAEDRLILQFLEDVSNIQESNVYSLSEIKDKLIELDKINHPKGMIECILSFIELVFSCLYNSSFKEQILVSRKSFLIILDLVKDEWKGTFIRILSGMLFDSIVIDNWCIQKELLKVFNAMCQTIGAALKAEIINMLPEITVYKLIDSLSSVGDYDMQVTIIESIFVLYGKSYLTEYQENLMPESQELSQNFAQISAANFDEDCRTFLNSFNNKRREVIFTLHCNKIQIEESDSISPMADGNGFWLDCNLSDKSLSWYQLDSQDSWDLITLFATDVKAVNINSTSKYVQIHIKLNDSCISSNDDTQSLLNDARNIFINIKKTDDEKHFTSVVLQKIFGKSLEETTQANKFSNMIHCYKPLNIKISKYVKSPKSPQSCSEVSSMFKKLLPQDGSSLASRSCHSNISENSVNSEGNDQNVMGVKKKCSKAGYSVVPIFQKESNTAKTTNTNNGSSDDWNTAKDHFTEDQEQCISVLPKDIDSKEVNLFLHNESEKNIKTVSTTNQIINQNSKQKCVITTSNIGNSDLNHKQHILFPENVPSQNVLTKICDTKSQIFQKESPTLISEDMDSMAVNIFQYERHTTEKVSSIKLVINQNSKQKNINNNNITANTINNNLNYKQDILAVQNLSTQNGLNEHTKFSLKPKEKRRKCTQISSDDSINPSVNSNNQQKQTSLDDSLDAERIIATSATIADSELTQKSKYFSQQNISNNTVTVETSINLSNNKIVLRKLEKVDKLPAMSINEKLEFECANNIPIKRNKKMNIEENSQLDNTFKAVMTQQNDSKMEVSVDNKENEESNILGHIIQRKYPTRNSKLVDPIDCMNTSEIKKISLTTKNTNSSKPKNGTPETFKTLEKSIESSYGNYSPQIFKSFSENLEIPTEISNPKNKLIVPKNKNKKSVTNLKKCSIKENRIPLTTRKKISLSPKSPLIKKNNQIVVEAEIHSSSINKQNQSGVMKLSTNRKRKYQSHTEMKDVSPQEPSNEVSASSKQLHTKNFQSVSQQEELHSPVEQITNYLGEQHQTTEKLNASVSQPDKNCQITEIVKEVHKSTPIVEVISNDRDVLAQEGLSKEKKILLYDSSEKRSSNTFIEDKQETDFYIRGKSESADLELFKTKILHKKTGDSEIGRLTPESNSSKIIDQQETFDELFKKTYYRDYEEYHRSKKPCGNVQNKTNSPEKSIVNSLDKHKTLEPDNRENLLKELSICLIRMKISNHNKICNDDKSVDENVLPKTQELDFLTESEQLELCEAERSKLFHLLETDNPETIIEEQEKKNDSQQLTIDHKYPIQDTQLPSQKNLADNPENSKSNIFSTPPQEKTTEKTLEIKKLKINVVDTPDKQRTPEKIRISPSKILNEIDVRSDLNEINNLNTTSVTFDSVKELNKSRSKTSSRKRRKLYDPSISDLTIIDHRINESDLSISSSAKFENIENSTVQPIITKRNISTKSKLSSTKINRKMPGLEVIIMAEKKNQNFHCTLIDRDENMMAVTENVVEQNEANITNLKNPIVVLSNVQLSNWAQNSATEGSSLLKNQLDTKEMRPITEIDGKDCPSVKTVENEAVNNTNILTNNTKTRKLRNDAQTNRNKNASFVVPTIKPKRKNTLINDSKINRHNNKLEVTDFTVDKIVETWRKEDSSSVHSSRQTIDSKKRSRIINKYNDLFFSKNYDDAMSILEKHNYYKFKRRHVSRHHFESPIGSPAPSWETSAVFNHNILTLNSDKYKGKYMVILFYPHDFASLPYALPPVEVVELSKQFNQFKEQKVEVFACSTDSVHTHKMWIKSIGEGSERSDIRIPILSDASHTISKAFNVFSRENAHSLRAMFIIDSEGKIIQKTECFLNIKLDTSNILESIRSYKSLD